MSEAVDASERLIRLIRENADQSNHGTGCDRGTIRAAEQLLGVALPPSYRRLVEEFGTWDIAGAEFLGVHLTPAGGDTPRGSVTETLDAPPAVRHVGRPHRRDVRRHGRRSGT